MLSCVCYNFWRELQRVRCCCIQKNVSESNGQTPNLNEPVSMQRFLMQRPIPCCQPPPLLQKKAPESPYILILSTLCLKLPLTQSVALVVMLGFVPIADPIFSLSPLAIHTRNILADPRVTLVVQIPGWSGLANARVTIFGDVYPLPQEQQV